MCESQTTRLEPRPLTLPSAVNPEAKSVTPRGFDSEILWKGGPERRGMRQMMVDYPDQDASQQALQSLDGRPELRVAVGVRYGMLLGALGQECQALETAQPKFLDSDRTELAMMAYRLEVQSQDYIKRIDSVLQQQFPLDKERQKLVRERLIQNYTNSEYDLLQHLARKVKQREVDRGVSQKRESLKLDPRSSEWQQLGMQWEEATGLEAANPDQSLALKERMMAGLADKHPGVVAKIASKAKEQGYYYFVPRDADKARAQEHDRQMNGVNAAQDRFMADLGTAQAGEVRSIPTTKLKDVYKDLDAISQEMKIHLMPQTKDEPMVMDRLLTMLERNPRFRDVVDAIKMRVVGNNKPDAYPELVLYTDKQNFNQILSALQTEFGELKGTGRQPRFNQEVANGLIYVAQSGGDLKEFLADKGVIDKFFDRNSGYAQMRT